MKAFRIFVTLILVMALISITWLMAFNKGSKESATKESKAWEALLASGALDGISDCIFHLGSKLSDEDVDYVNKQYRDSYERFLSASANVSDDSMAFWLIENHMNGKMHPDEFHAMLLQHNTSLTSSAQSRSNEK